MPNNLKLVVLCPPAGPVATLRALLAAALPGCVPDWKTPDEWDFATDAAGKVVLLWLDAPAAPAGVQLGSARILVLHPAEWSEAERDSLFWQGARACLPIDTAPFTLRQWCHSLGDFTGDLAGLEAQEICTALMDSASDMVFLIRPEAPKFPILRCNAAVNRALGEFERIPRGAELSRYLTTTSTELLTSLLPRLLSVGQDAIDLAFRARDAERLDTSVVVQSVRSEGRIALLLTCGLARAHRARRNDSGRLRLMAARSGMAVYDIDVRDSVVRMGGGIQQLTGYTPSEFEAYQHGRWLYLVHPDDRALVSDTYENALADAGKYEIEYRLRHKTGEYRYVEDSAVVTTGRDGRAARVLGTLKDVHQRVKQAEAFRRAEESRLHSQKLESLGVLAGGIAHDFNNILAAIIGLTAMAIKDTPEGSQLRTDLTDVLQGGYRARDLVRQILAFSRQEETERTALELHLVAGEVLRLLNVSLPPNVQIRAHLDRHAGSILANPAQMHQMVLNYCMNAIHAMRDRGGFLTVTVDSIETLEGGGLHPLLAAGQFVRLTVRDEGHGMAEPVRERIFDPFYTTKGPGEGTGMGLAVVHGIVTAHGGVIDVKTEPGVGSVFTTYLPRYVPEKNQTPKAKRDVAEGIVLVRTDQVIGSVMSASLKHQGYSVREISGLEKAAREVTAGNVPNAELFVVDAGLSHEGVRELVETFCREIPDMPLLLVHAPEPGIPEAALGRLHFLEKPLAFEHISRKIREILHAG